MELKILGVLVGLIIVVGGGYWLLSGKSPEPSATTDQGQQAASSTASVSPAATTTSDTTKIMSATLHTSMGDITVEFSPQTAPNTVANFIKLAESGFYSSTKFHRVIKGFMIQGGDPLTKDDTQEARWGTGGPGYTFNDEIAPGNNNAKGTIAMANSGPNTQGSQFFINAVDNPSLNSGYTVFGKVTAGLDVVEKINVVPTDSADRPLQPVVLQSVTLQ